MIKKLVVLTLLLIMIGCTTEPLPVIKDHHWKRNLFGYVLWNNNGEIGAVFNFANGDMAQVCTYEKPESGCKYFETNKQALAWLKEQYKEKQ